MALPVCRNKPINYHTGKTPIVNHAYQRTYRLCQQSVSIGPFTVMALSKTFTVMALSKALILCQQLFFTIIARATAHCGLWYLPVLTQLKVC